MKGYTGIKIKSDGTPAGTIITTTDGRPITTVTKFTIIMDANRAQSKAIIECALPEVEMELPDSSIDFLPGSIKQCPKCGNETVAEMTNKEKELFTRYRCYKCNWEKEYPFEFNWDSQKVEFDSESIKKALGEEDGD